MSAAFNIGSMARDVNLPTFAFAALRTAGQVRFSYSRPRSDTVAGELLTRIDFRVPVDMRERYDNSWGEVTTGHARYSHYRRFRTSGRLVRPGG